MNHQTLAAAVGEADLPRLTPGDVARASATLAEARLQVKFAQAATMYSDNPTALHLRAMNMLYEAIKEKGAMVIVPSTAVEPMGLGGMLGTASESRAEAPPAPMRTAGENCANHAS